MTASQLVKALLQNAARKVAQWAKSLVFRVSLVANHPFTKLAIDLVS
jgi:hypothetical protein